MTLIALSMAPFCLLAQDDLNKVQHQFSGHLIPILPYSITALHLLAEDDQNKTKHDFFSYLKLLPLTSASFVANGSVSSTNVFIKSQQLKLCAT